MDIFLRNRMLIGGEAMGILEEARITVCGLGGVGSWAGEALIRSGIGHLTIIDFDQIACSNINRQLPAFMDTVGRSKTSLLKERFQRINPQAEILEITSRLEIDNLAEMIGDCDYLIDAIDDIPVKTHLIAYCLERKIPIVSSMGTGNKLAPEMLKVADISKTSVCPLARELRKRLRKLGIEKGLTVVYSEEPPHKVETEFQAPASMVFVPGAAGLILASLAVRELIDKGRER